MDPTSLQHFMTKYPFREILDSNGAPTGQFVTCPVRLAFAYLGTPRERVSQRTGEKFNSWGAVLIVPPQADMAVPLALAGRAAAQRFGANWRNMELNNPFRPQAKNAGKYDGFAPEGVFFDTESRYPVPVFGGRPDHTGKLPALDCANPEVVYSGMWGLALLNVYTYPDPGAKGPSKQGVKFGLRQIQKICDDEAFKGGNEPSDAFGAIDHLHGQQSTQAPAAGAPSNGFGQQAPQAPANPGNPSTSWY